MERPLHDMYIIGCQIHVSYSIHLEMKYAASLTFILQVWCTYTTPEALEQQVVIDEHSPGPFRYRIYSVASINKENEMNLKD